MGSLSADRSYGKRWHGEKKDSVPSGNAKLFWSWVGFPFFDFEKNQLRNSFGLAGCGFGFSFVFNLNKRFKVIQVRRPEDAVLLDPRIHGAQGFWIELVDAISSFAMFTNQVGSAQQAEVLGDGRTRYRERLGYLSCGLAAPAKQIQDRPARRIGESLEGLLRRICNFLVTHHA